MVIPLIAALLISNGMVFFVWYQFLPKKKKELYDNAVIGLLVIAFEKVGISIDPSDDLKTIEAKVSEVDISKNEVKKIFEEAHTEARRRM